MAGDLPSIQTSTYSNTLYTPTWTLPEAPKAGFEHTALRRLGERLAKQGFATPDEDEFEPESDLVVGAATPTQPKEPEMTPRRLIRLFVVDKDPNLPTEHAVLYRDTEERFTDATDEELRLELDIKQLLEEHNRVRQGILDKEATRDRGADVYLEPIRIRDLVLSVVELARF